MRSVAMRCSFTSTVSFDPALRNSRITTDPGWSTPASILSTFFSLPLHLTPSIVNNSSPLWTFWELNAGPPTSVPVTLQSPLLYAIPTVVLLLDPVVVVMTR
jgi:hypothetical protein